MNHRLLLKLAAVDTQSSLNGNQSQPAARTSSMTVGGRALAVAGGIQRLVLVVGRWAYTVWRFVARIGGVEVKSSALPGAGRGTGWGGGRIQVEKQWGEGGKKKRGRPLPLLSSFRLFPSLCLTALWPPSWFPAGPGVTWSLWAPGREPLRGVAGSARPLWREKRLLMPGCRVWLEQLHLRGKSQDDQQHILFSN